MTTVQPQDRTTHIFGRTPLAPPRVVIYSETGPTGEDLQACLEGPFRVEVTTCIGEAVEALNDPAAVLLVVPADDPEPMIDWSTLLHRALIRDCRVMVLGPTGTALEDSFKNEVSTYPEIPDPARLHRDLNELIV